MNDFTVSWFIYWCYDDHLFYIIICNFMTDTFIMIFYLTSSLLWQYITQRSWDKWSIAPYQKGGNRHSDDEASDYIRPVVAVLCHPVNPSQEGQAHQPQRHDGLGQPSPFGFDWASDVHLKQEERRKDPGSHQPKPSSQVDNQLLCRALTWISSGLVPLREETLCCINQTNDR